MHSHHLRVDFSSSLESLIKDLAFWFFFREVVVGQKYHFYVDNQILIVFNDSLFQFCLFDLRFLKLLLIWFTMYDFFADLIYDLFYKLNDFVLNRFWECCIVWLLFYCTIAKWMNRIYLLHPIESWKS